MSQFFYTPVVRKRNLAEHQLQLFSNINKGGVCSWE